VLTDRPLLELGRKVNRCRLNSGTRQKTRSGRTHRRIILNSFRWINVRSKSDAFDYLVTFASAKRDDQETLFYSLIDRLGEMIGRRLQHLETVNQLHLALTDSFIKYAVSTLPDVAAQLLEAARLRRTHIYERINITAARAFQRRRKSDAYDSPSLGIEEDTEQPI
jgi:hypothetical protein